MIIFSEKSPLDQAVFLVVLIVSIANHKTQYLHYQNKQTKNSHDKIDSHNFIYNTTSSLISNQYNCVFLLNVISRDMNTLL